MSARRIALGATAVLGLLLLPAVAQAQAVSIDLGHGGEAKAAQALGRGMVQHGMTFQW